MSKILVIADYTEQNPVAIKRALNLAQAFDAELDIVYFCYESLRDVPGDHAIIQSKILATVELNADTQFKKIDTKGVTCHRSYVWEKHIANWVDDYVAKQMPAMVMKTGNRSETLFYTPTDWQLLRECKAPVMIVAEEKWRKTPNILAAIDLGSKNKSKLALNKQILSEATRMAKHIDTQVFVSYTVSCSPLLKDLGMQYCDEMEAEAQQKYQSAIAELAKEYDIPEQNFDIHAGLPENVIPSTAAKYKAGLVVIGTMGRKGIAGKLMGNTAEKILKLLKSDVLAIKPQ